MTMTKLQTNREPKMTKAARLALTKYRKGALRPHSIVELALEAEVSYSMAEKWMKGQRDSERCARAFLKLTGKPSDGHAA